MTINVSVKNVKNTRGIEGNGFTCSVYIDGRRVCEAEDWGDGGCVFFRGASAADLALLKEAGKAYILANREKYDFMFTNGELTSLVEIEAWSIHHLIDKHFEDKQLRGWCRTKIVLALPNLPAGQYATISTRYLNTPAQDATILAMNPGAEIVNKRFL